MKIVQFGQDLDGIIDGKPTKGAVLISTGAGGDMNTPLLVKSADELKLLGYLTLRWNFGYVKSRRAPSAGGKREIPEMLEAVEFLKKQSKGAPISLMGKSFGARLSTYVGATMEDISGYVFYGIPLQGISKNPKPRDWTHLTKLTGQALFITGDRDRLCPLEKLGQVQKLMSIPYHSEIVAGDHSFKPRGENEAIEKMVAWFKTLG